MKLGAGRTVIVGCLLFILLLTVDLASANVTEFQVDSTELQIYRDGLVRVTQTLTVNETLPVVTFPLLGSLVDNFIVLDENQTVLDYEINLFNLTVFTLGTTSVSVQYDTHSLTLKNAEVWTFIVDAPYNMTVVLPEESTIVYLNEMPTSIDTEDSKIALSLFANQWEISYIFPFNPSAEFQIGNLVVTPTEVKAGEEVTVSVRITNVGGQAGSYTLPLTVNQTVEDTRTVTLDKEESIIAEFKVTKQTLGMYNIEIADLLGQFTVSETPSNGSHSDSIPIEYLVAVAVVMAVILLVLFLIFRRRIPNTKKIVKMNPQLNQEEKDVIQFLVENEGKAFEAEIREKFPDIPRTSLWRLVKRLEKLDIVSIKKIGLENRLELKK